MSTCMPYSISYLKRVRGLSVILPARELGHHRHGRFTIKRSNRTHCDEFSAQLDENSGHYLRYSLDILLFFIFGGKDGNHTVIRPHLVSFRSLIFIVFLDWTGNQRAKWGWMKCNAGFLPELNWGCDHYVVDTLTAQLQVPPGSVLSNRPWLHIFVLLRTTYCI